MSPTLMRLLIFLLKSNKQRHQQKPSPCEWTMEEFTSNQKYLSFVVTSRALWEVEMNMKKKKKEHEHDKYLKDDIWYMFAVTI